MDKDTELRVALENYNAKINEVGEACDAIADLYEKHGDYVFATLIRQRASIFKDHKLEIPMD